MDPIIVESQISLNQFYKINMYLLYRKRVMWYLGIIVIIMLSGMFMNISDSKDNFKWLGIFFCLFYLLTPFFIYRAVSKNYKKVQATREIKIYSFNKDKIDVRGQSVSMTMDWSHLEKVIQRKKDFLVLTSNSLGLHYLPKSGFTSDGKIHGFIDLLREKNVKLK